MDSTLKIKDSNSSCSSSASVAAATTTTTFIQQQQQQHGATTTTAIANICISDRESYSIIPSVNSNELNTAASLSDDSGVPLTTNSSISSGDSYRLGMCKFEIEMVESDGEVSQFDSLDNCSEGGMSAENFNTLKKGPLAPIDPPPEFQDSPKSTLVRSISKNIVNNLRRWTSSQSSFEHLKERSNSDMPELCVGASLSHDCSSRGGVGDDDDDDDDDAHTLRDTYALSKHLYSSDSILNSYTDNIYDEPNNIISTSLGNSVDIIEAEGVSPVPPPPPPVSIVKIQQTLFQDQTRYFKAIVPADHLTVASTAVRFNANALSEIHDYDLYYGAKRSAYQQQQQQQQQHDSSLQRKLLYSPLQHAHYHHAGMNLYGNRPNSRNSLNSRLSSSHNSLRVSSANKPDDSIFITQAMSHDALLTREITDFYNVPIDSDIYAFPVDMIQNEKVAGAVVEDAVHAAAATKPQQMPNATNEAALQLATSKTNRRQKRQRHNKSRNGGSGEEKSVGGGSGVAEKQRHSAATTRAGKHKCSGGGAAAHNTLHAVGGGDKTPEPLHMTLDEVKQFYHTLYADGRTTAVSGGGGGGPTTKSSNETIWSTSSTRSRGTNSLCNQRDTGKHGTALAAKSNNNNNSKKPPPHIADCENINNNNNNNNNNHIVSIASQQYGVTAAITTPPTTTTTTVSASKNGGVAASGECAAPLGQILSKATQSEASAATAASLLNQQHSNKQQRGSLPGEKRSHFTFSLKQKFCSIFRFRRGHNRCRANGAAATGACNHVMAHPTDESREPSTPLTTECKRKKFQSRALPPLPKKSVEPAAVLVEQQPDALWKPEPRAYQFTSSIEKVKDYGWYWGPLSSEAAEKVLSNEPDGSFIVRDSSDDHYIFSLSFKLNNCVRHVRIEQDQGTFSFGSYAKFKSQTITEFIEKAVEHSRSGRYLFFLHRRPEHGPMRVQLTNPVSRFKHVQSLQHMCRFVILKAVIRKDLIQTLPLPRRLLDYLNYKHCYSEQVESDSSHSQLSGEGL